MKTKRLKLAGIFLLSAMIWSCSKTETGIAPTALKDAITGSAQNFKQRHD